MAKNATLRSKKQPKPALLLKLIFGLQIRVPRFDSELRLQYLSGFPALSKPAVLRKTPFASQK